MKAGAKMLIAATVVIACAVVAILVWTDGIAKASEPATVAAEQAKKTVEGVREPVASRIEEMRTRLQRVAELKEQVAKAGQDAEAFDRVVSELEQLAAFFQEFAAEETRLQETIRGGVQGLAQNGAFVQSHVDRDLQRIEELNDAAQRATLAPERRGYTLAAAFVQRRVDLMRSLEGVNRKLGDGLGQITARVSALARVSQANAQVFHEAAVTARYARDVSRASAVLREVSDAGELNRLIADTEQVWDSLSGMVDQIIAYARQAANISE